MEQLREKPLRHLLSLAIGCLGTIGFAAPLSADDAHRVPGHILSADISEIQLGQLAATKGHNAAVRNFGRILVADNQGMREPSWQAEQTREGAETQEFSESSRKIRERLHDLHGEEFDREFARYMTQSHLQKLAYLNKRNRGDHGGASASERRRLAILRKHLLMAESLSGKDGRFYEGWQTRPSPGAPGKGWYQK